MPVMTADAPDPGIRVQMTMMQWHCIDGCADNEVSAAVDDYRDDLIESATAIRETGWHQVAGGAQGAPGWGNWPPDDTLITVTMSRSLWSLAVHIVDYWEAVHLRQAPDADQASWLRLREIILTALDGDLTLRQMR